MGVCSYTILQNTDFIHWLLQTSLIDSYQPSHIFQSSAVPEEQVIVNISGCFPVSNSTTILEDDRDLFSRVLTQTSGHSLNSPIHQCTATRLPWQPILCAGLLLHKGRQGANKAGSEVGRQEAKSRIESSSRWGWRDASAVKSAFVLQENQSSVSKTTLVYF